MGLQAQKDLIYGEHDQKSLGPSSLWTICQSWKQLQRFWPNPQSYQGKIPGNPPPRSHWPTNTQEGMGPTTCQPPWGLRACGVAFLPEVYSCCEFPSVRFFLAKRTLAPAQGTHSLSRTVGNGLQGFFYFKSRHSIQG